MNAVRRIDDDVRAILSAGVCDGVRYYLPKRQLDRPMYERVNNVLVALGGKWMKGAKAHVFADVAEPVIEGAIETGEYTRPADLGWFPTPPDLAARVVNAARVTWADRVLEPSAGEGAIASAVLNTGAHVVCYEIDARRSERLASTLSVLANREAWSARCVDFLAVEPEPTFDAVAMNPPFAKRADIAHVLHAQKFLKPNGRLAAIMSGGVAFREDRLAREFRDACDSIEQLPAQSFRASGTDVNTVLVTMRGKP